MELPANIVEEIQEAKDKEAKVLEVESKPEEISETKPIESVEEKFELENIADVQVHASALEKLGEAEELPLLKTWKQLRTKNRKKFQRPSLMKNWRDWKLPKLKKKQMNP